MTFSIVSSSHSTQVHGGLAVAVAVASASSSTSGVSISSPRGVLISLTCRVSVLFLIAFVCVAVSTLVTLGCDVSEDVLLSSFFWYFLVFSSRLAYSILSFVRLSLRFFVWRLSPFDGVLAAVFKRYSAFLRFSFSTASSLLRLCICSNEEQI